MPSHKPRILIADDSEMNRAILADMLEQEYDIVEAENGLEAVSALETYGAGLSLVLLDIVMPKLDGFGVLAAMNERHWIDDVPVIMISSESQPAAIERAYNMGISDFISRPFDMSIVHHRVVNTILLYAKQKKLISLVEQQVRENVKQSGMMIDILSHIVEFRNGESGLHVLHIRSLTELFLRHLAHRNDQYHLTPRDIGLISVASALHDIGKIAIPSEILNKPGKLTAEEFDAMKTHTTLGASMLQALETHREEPLVKTAYEICRWHHERWDGRGYPDGLKGDDIPISAQIVALADVYDALTSTRVYKPPFPHETAITMILNGECGSFNPTLLECLTELSDQIPAALTGQGAEDWEPAAKDLANDALSASDRTLDLLEQERMKYNFLAQMSGEIQFEYVPQSATLTLTTYGAARLGLPEAVTDPLSDSAATSHLDPEFLSELRQAVATATPEHSVIDRICHISLAGEPRWVRLTCQVLWSDGEPPKYARLIGKLVDIHEAKTRLDELELLVGGRSQASPKAQSPTGTEAG